MMNNINKFSTSLIDIYSKRSSSQIKRRRSVSNDFTLAPDLPNQFQNIPINYYPKTPSHSSHQRSPSYTYSTPNERAKTPAPVLATSPIDKGNKPVTISPIRNIDFYNDRPIKKSVTPQFVYNIHRENVAGNIILKNGEFPLIEYLASRIATALDMDLEVAKVLLVKVRNLHLEGHKISGRINLATFKQGQEISNDFHHFLQDPSLYKKLKKALDSKNFYKLMLFALTIGANDFAASQIKISGNGKIGTFDHERSLPRSHFPKKEDGEYYARFGCFLLGHPMVYAPITAEIKKLILSDKFSIKNIFGHMYGSEFTSPMTLDFLTAHLKKDSKNKDLTMQPASFDVSEIGPKRGKKLAERISVIKDMVRKNPSISMIKIFKKLFPVDYYFYTLAIKTVNANLDLMKKLSNQNFNRENEPFNDFGMREFANFNDAQVNFLAARLLTQNSFEKILNMAKQIANAFREQGIQRIALEKRYNYCQELLKKLP